MMKNFANTILHLVITSIIYMVFNEAAMITLDQGSLFSGSILGLSFFIYGPACYFIAKHFEFGRWKYVFFIPFINEILYLFIIYNSNLRDYFPLEDDNYGVGMMLLPLTIIMWIIFIVSTFLGIQGRKKRQ